MFRHCSVILCLCVAVLVGLGLTMLASTSVWVKGLDAPYHFLSRQAMMVVGGLFFATIAALVRPEFLRKHAAWAMFGICVLLALCFVPGIGIETYGSKRWIKAPVVGQFQPSELAKIVTMIALAAWYARWQTETKTFWRGFVIPGLIALAPIALIAGETDVGSALSLSVGVAAVMFCIGTRLIYLLPSAALAMSAAWFYIRHNENRWARIEAWLDLENPVHQLDRGMQQWRALLALGNGGPTGVGLGNGIEKFGTLTFAHIDFIFPVIGEELGLPATLGVILCYVVIAICGFGIAMRTEGVFSRCLAIGLTTIIVIPAMVNIAVTTAVLPNDGLPLPFVSYGGTSLLFSLMAVGMLVGIDRRSRARQVRSFTLDPQTRLAVRL